MQSLSKISSLKISKILPQECINKIAEANKYPKINLYYSMRPDKRKDSDYITYIRVHLRFGPINSEGLYESRHNSGPPLPKITYQEIWNTWKYHTIDFNPYRMITLEDNPRSFYAFDVVFSDLNEYNVDIISVKQSELEGFISDEQCDIMYDKNSKWQPIAGFDCEFMP